MPDGARTVDATVGDGATVVPVPLDAAVTGPGGVGRGGVRGGGAGPGGGSGRAALAGRAGRAGRWLLGRTWWPGLLVLALGGWGLTRPALWPDEFAT